MNSDQYNHKSLESGPSCLGSPEFELRSNQFGVVRRRVVRLPSNEVNYNHMDYSDVDSDDSFDIRYSKRHGKSRRPILSAGWYRYKWPTPRRRMSHEATKFPFPIELVIMIFKNLLIDSESAQPDPCTAICFALTCCSHWDSFRQIFADKLPLKTVSPGSYHTRLGSVRLGNFLQEWMAPKYRPIHWSVSSRGALKKKSVFVRDLYVIAAKYDVEGVEEMEKKLAFRIYEYKRNHFSHLHRVSRNHPNSAVLNGNDLSWHVPNPFDMGDDWYPATAFILKHTILHWPPFCSTYNEEEDWLDTVNYPYHYAIWKTYQSWMLRDWVEEQPQAVEYKKLHGFFIHGVFQMG
ncbi:hypothetical protein DSL72_001454 [Monilinia vaccinii-corymbosi]|uniref:Uncharacterized protein n=1 Tax=Monilinia vaccinii-corymbosi TaxID=61207 RepID=A0A8A3P1X2_9HELO|nr:hypothetical protein DSL72_001454 [Monilinia vaccinii-corymbosi]